MYNLMMATIWPKHVVSASYPPFANYKVFEISTSGWLNLHILLVSLFYNMYNLMMATIWPKHVAAASYPPFASYKLFEISTSGW